MAIRISIALAMALCLGAPGALAQDAAPGPVAPAPLPPAPDAAAPVPAPAPSEKPVRVLPRHLNLKEGCPTCAAVRDPSRPKIGLEPKTTGAAACRAKGRVWDTANRKCLRSGG
ncbi:hypothetical protein EWM63_03505 [Pseudoduganella lutea]|uniref:Uncharacterized protein n=1 Tax=Pseudoduganella lutea TaxID=321985 RepID=A0A4P6KTQ5_9BURK|nr:hypothetical protein EWM63_03505 [Pseudoduganella lutea]